MPVMVDLKDGENIVLYTDIQIGVILHLAYPNSCVVYRLQPVTCVLPYDPLLALY